MCGLNGKSSNCPDERRQNMMCEFKNLIDCIERTEAARQPPMQCIFQPTITPCMVMPCPQPPQPEPCRAQSRQSQRLECKPLPPYERLPCRPANPQPIQQTVHSQNNPCFSSQPQCPSDLPTNMYVQCDPPTHVYKNPTYQPWPPGPECPKPRVSHYAGDRKPPVLNELRGGQRLSRCDCYRYNGLQDECQLTACGIPECHTVPPTCIPSGGPGPKNGGGKNGNEAQLCCPPGYAPYLYSPPQDYVICPPPQQDQCMPQCFVDPCMAQMMCCSYPNN